MGLGLFKSGQVFQGTTKGNELERDEQDVQRIFWLSLIPFNPLWCNKVKPCHRIMKS
jgi:hypothetical protein